MSNNYIIMIIINIIYLITCILVNILWFLDIPYSIFLLSVIFIFGICPVLDAYFINKYFNGGVDCIKIK